MSSFHERAARLTEFNHLPGVKVIDNTPPSVRVGHLFYLNPGDKWQANDLYELGGEAHVIGGGGGAQWFPGGTVPDVLAGNARRYLAA